MKIRLIGVSLLAVILLAAAPVMAQGDTAKKTTEQAGVAANLPEWQENLMKALVGEESVDDAIDLAIAAGADREEISEAMKDTLDILAQRIKGNKCGICKKLGCCDASPSKPVVDSGDFCERCWENDCCK